MGGFNLTGELVGKNEEKCSDAARVLLLARLGKVNWGSGYSKNDVLFDFFKCLPLGRSQECWNGVFLVQEASCCSANSDITYACGLPKLEKVSNNTSWYACGLPKLENVSNNTSWLGDAVVTSQGHWSILVSFESKQKGHGPIFIFKLSSRISLEICMDCFLSNLSDRS